MHTDNSQFLKSPFSDTAQCTPQKCGLTFILVSLQGCGVKGAFGAFIRAFSVLTETGGATLDERVILGYQTPVMCTPVVCKADASTSHTAFLGPAGLSCGFIGSNSLAQF